MKDMDVEFTYDTMLETKLEGSKLMIEVRDNKMVIVVTPEEI